MKRVEWLASKFKAAVLCNVDKDGKDIDNFKKL